MFFVRQGDCPRGAVAAIFLRGHYERKTPMARKNRMSVYDGIYHVTARIANRAMLLGEDAIKDQILEWIISVAAFSGVEVWSFAIMDNHLHVFVHVPPVPRTLLARSRRRALCLRFRHAPAGTPRAPLVSRRGLSPCSASVARLHARRRGDARTPRAPLRARPRRGEGKGLGAAPRAWSRRPSPPTSATTR